MTKVVCEFRHCLDRTFPCTAHPWSSWERLVRGRNPFDVSGWRGVDLFFLLQIAALWIAVAVALGGCATRPAQIPTLPPPLDLGQLVGPAPGPFVAPPHVRRYPDTPIRTGQCRDVPGPGILVSPAVYAEQVASEAELVRLRREVEARERLRLAERAAAEDLEQACRARAAELEAGAARSATWRGIVLFLAGGAIGLVTGFATAKTVTR